MMFWKSRYEKFLEAELERVRNDYRIVLSALLEYGISREAAMMLRKPEELNLSLTQIRERARALYEARDEASRKSPTTQGEPTTVRTGWRGNRAEAEEASRKAVAGSTSNDSITRLESKLPGGSN